MNRNLANWDRAARVIAALASFAIAGFAPLPLVPRLLLGVGTGVYLLFTSLSGTCLGYRLLGMSTCPRTLRT